jgi:TRAP-type C4-dicarboxylate transport system substrate-binding protein
MLARRSWTVSLVPLVALLVSGCAGGSHQTKAGVSSHRTLSLVMQGADGADADTQYFAAEVSRRTNGHIRIVVGGDYSSADPDNELRLARALRAGKVKLGYLTARAWERDGINGFQALQAPFLITNYGMLKAVVGGPVGARMLAHLGRVGLVGLGLVPNELRRPLGRRPLLSAAAYRGARVRVVTSPTSELDLRALGARPVTDLSAYQTFAALRDGRLDGVESSTEFILANDYVDAAAYLPANVVLFAKAQTIVMGKRFFAQLASADQIALRAAAAATVAHANPAAEERTEVSELCRSGLRVPSATRQQIQSLRDAGARATAVLERDAFTRDAISEIKREAGETPAVATLAPCPRAARDQVASSAPGDSFPTGTYETRITVADLRDTGFPPSFAHFERVTFRKDGTWRDVWFHPRLANQPPGGGHYTVHGNVVKLVPANPDTVRWSYYRGVLTFTIIDVSDAFARFTYTVHPWRKVN